MNVAQPSSLSHGASPASPPPPPSSPPPTTTVMSRVRKLVSRKKRRYRDEDGFDLDLTYITPRVIAMAAPSTGVVESAFRNPMAEVKRFLEARHQDKYKVYNLCCPEEGSHYHYNDSKGGGDGDGGGGFARMERFPMEDRCPCALTVIHSFCMSVAAFMASHPDNVVAVHCRSGKGRTGLMVACHLMHSGVCGSAEEALALFAKMRTTNGQGVTVPSQVRYAHYYHAHIRQRQQQQPSAMPQAPTPPVFHITHIRLVTVPSIKSGGCEPYVVIKAARHAAADGGGHGSGDGRGRRRQLEREVTVFNQLKAAGPGGKARRYLSASDRYAEMDLLKHAPILVRGDVKLLIKDWQQLNIGGDETICQVWFHTSFVRGHVLVLEKDVVDKAAKDTSCRRFDAHFKVEIYLTPFQDQHHHHHHSHHQSPPSPSQKQQQQSPVQTAPKQRRQSQQQSLTERIGVVAPVVATAAGAGAGGGGGGGVTLAATREAKESFSFDNVLAALDDSDDDSDVGAAGGGGERKGDEGGDGDGDDDEDDDEAIMVVKGGAGSRDYYSSSSASSSEEEGDERQRARHRHFQHSSSGGKSTTDIIKF